MPTLQHRRLLLFGGAAAVVYLLLDRFTTDHAAPLATPRTAEPGPGALTITDSGSHMSISGGKLLSRGIVGAGDPKIVSSTGIPFVAGRAMLMKGFVWNTNRSGGGWATNTTPTGNPNWGVMDVSGNLTIVPPGISTNQFSLSVSYDFAFIRRNAGAFILSKLSATGTWTLYWVDNVVNVSNMYPGVWARVTDCNIDVGELKVTDLGGVWASDYGFA